MNIKGVYFTETQYYKTAWVWLIALLIESTIFIMLIADYDKFDIDKFELEDFYIMWGIFSIMFLGLFFLFRYMYIEMIINSEGVHYKAPPMLNKYKIIEPHNIFNYSIGKYKPITEVGGRGYKPNSKKTQIALTMEGNIGLKIKTKDGKVFIFGTLREAALLFAMNKLMENS